MKAVWYTQFGTADAVLEYGERPDPQVGAGEVLVRVHRSGVNPSDTTKRAGALKNLLDEGYVIPHSDGAGIIEAVGSGVAASRVGERVWTYQAQYERRFGTAAEYVALPDNRAPVLAGEADFETGACLGVPAMTAHRCVFADGDISGQSVLVTGGVGRVGWYAIQWAVQAGARVIATASTEQEREECLSLGAIAAVNHRDPDWGKQVLSANNGEKIQRVIEVEFGVNLPQIMKIIANNGVIATYSSLADMNPCIPFYRMMFKDLSVRLVLVYAMPETAKQQAVSDIEAALRSERLRHRIARVDSLSDCAAAHQTIEAAKIRGCVLLSL